MGPSSRTGTQGSRNNRIALASSLSILILVSIATPITAAPPAGYYNSVDTTDESTLRTTLHNVIDDHTRFPYTSGATDTWNILESAQQDPADSGRIIDVYRNGSFAKIGGGVGPYNREHTWPKSYGFPDDNSDNYPYTDCFQLFLCDSGFNSARSNKPFRTCNPGCIERTTDVNNGQGGGSGSYPGNSNWTSGSFTQGTWEVWAERRGDIARAQFYLDVRYEGGMHGITNSPEPDLILTNNEALIEASNTGQNESVAYMGMLSVLLQWHLEDPVDDWERDRNDVVFSYQGNRNPFIDHPEWVACIFSANCGAEGTPPAAPTGLAATPGDAVVNLNWDDNAEPDFDGYSVYRSTTIGGPYSLISGPLLANSDYSDVTVTNGTTYFYVVSATNTNAEESNNSAEVSALPHGAGGNPTGPPWINEFHYDNSGGDSGEFVEIAGPAGTDLANWTVYGYNGNGGTIYKQVVLSGIIPDQGGCMGTLSFAFSGMQNGAPDGLALADPMDNVILFISYEGVVNATEAPASGMSSIDIGVSEQPAPAAGQSLQLTGTGAQYADFTWVSPGPETEGLPNSGQTLDGCTGDSTPPDAPTGLIATDEIAQVSLDWDDNIEADLAGYDVYRSTTPGGPLTQINGSLVLTSDFTDTTAANCTTYYYVVTASDESDNESGDSNEDAATPSPSGSAAGDCDANGIPDDCQPDDDNDGTINACDDCPNDPDKQTPGACGCGTPDSDFDMDGTPDCDDLCPIDPDKQAPGTCGCGTPDTDFDMDGTPDCNDQCPIDPDKQAPGTCGCGTPDTDSDMDGTADCDDLCPNDPDKQAPGICGCGIPDTDSDMDGTADCDDLCPNDPDKQAPGTCGCGLPDTDSDMDGTADCDDLCPNDPDKQAPGSCGCGNPDIADGDMNEDGFVDGRDLQQFASALTSGTPTAAELCHGDFDGFSGIDAQDIPGMIDALVNP